jgi:hypothetical protein
VKEEQILHILLSCFFIQYEANESVFLPSPSSTALPLFGRETRIEGLEKRKKRKKHTKKK